MKDEQDEFYDELIGVDADDEDAFAGDDDDEADDDDDEAQVRTAVLAKRDMLALLSLKVTTTGGLIVRVDPRQSLPVGKNYADVAEAVRWFGRSLTTSRGNGWHVIYDGEPLYG